MSEGFKFCCPICTQRMRAFDEHIDAMVNCPTCEEAIAVPNPYEHAGDDISMGFNQDEWELLNEESGEIIEYITSLSKFLSWEIGAGAALLANRMVNYSNVFEYREMSFHLAQEDDLLNFLSYANKARRTFFSIQRILYDNLTHKFLRASTNNNLIDIYMFVNQIDNTLKVLKNFHDHLYENTIPQDEPYIEMQEILVTWAPNVFLNLQEAVDQLKIRSEDIRSLNKKPFLNVSFFPPGLGRFLILFRNLQKKVNDQEGVESQ